ncbi:vesicle transport protein USE1-like [Halichondria panicea]|uniref:vesicle transport protein USE1-like n=1 Tax=Halichondria panicea TaxID=6063 RepID=UPI00312B5BB2
MIEAVNIKIRNVERLLSRCESILSGKTQFQGKEWKLGKYVTSLEEHINDLEKYPSVNNDQLTSFRQRTGVLREVLQTEKETDNIFNGACNHTGKSGLTLPLTHTQHSRSSHCHSPLPSPVHARGNELLLRADSKRTSSMRDQLFAKTIDDETSLRHRGTAALKEDIDSVVNRHQKMQDEIAEDMIRMAHSLKNNSLVAKEIMLSDNKALEKTLKAADNNIEGLDRETGRLQEHTSGCAWGIWILLLVVFVVFFAMILLIRIVPKPRT